MSGVVNATVRETATTHTHMYMLAAAAATHLHPIFILLGLLALVEQIALVASRALVTEHIQCAKLARRPDLNVGIVANRRRTGVAFHVGKQLRRIPILLGASSNCNATGWEQPSGSHP